MPAVLHHIKQVYPSEVAILVGAEEELVTHRELRNKYETNRDIKSWSCWFLLKALTTSGQIQQWQKQLDFLLPWVQMNENTFRRRLKEMLQLQIISLDDNCIHLVSFEKAADILGIVYTGTIKISYNYQHGKNQVFQYLLRCIEMENNQQAQLCALLYKLDENPTLKQDLHCLMVKAGADDQRLHKESSYFQEQLLNLQLMLFKTGSAIFVYATAHRADINRSVCCIQKYHHYKSAQSVSYLKHRMKKLGLIRIEKVSAESKARTRLYVPDPDGGRRDGYKWIERRKTTVWFLTDQIAFTYDTQPQKKAAAKSSKVA